MRSASPGLQFEMPPRLLFLVAAAVLALCAVAYSGLSPATLSASFFRSRTGEDLPGPYYRGMVLRLTNCVVYADDIGAITQALDEVRVVCSVGTTAGSRAFTGTVASAAAGAFWCDVTVPTSAVTPQYLQVSLVDTGGTVRFVYPARRMETIQMLR